MSRTSALRRAIALFSTIFVLGLAGIPAASAVPLLSEGIEDPPASLEVTGTQPSPPAAPVGSETRSLWTRVAGPVPEAHDGNPAVIAASRFRAFRLDRAGLGSVLGAAPDEHAPGGGVVVALPAPAGGFELFEVRESPIMEPGLAARHPSFRTLSGRGITDPAATIRASLTSLGFHASVRGSEGSWYIDPYYHLDESLYVTYFGRDLENVHGPLVEQEAVELEVALERLGAAQALAVPVGDQLRTYRVAFATDPVYGQYFDPTGTQPANVTAAKVVLMNRVTQIYEDETSIRLMLVSNTDLLNFDTNAEATGADGQCGSAPCYTAAQLSGCSGALLNRNQVVIGMIIGASSYDLGHIGLGGGGGGLAGSAVGAGGKARGCTGVSPPIGDRWAVDYVAHEMGHQFTAPHTFNGTQSNCSGGNRNGPTSVEPGSGSSIMAYAGICGSDDLQPNSDPHWSQDSFETVSGFVTTAFGPLDEVQNVALRSFDGTDSFTLTYAGNTSGTITRGSNYNTAGIQAALASILPAGASTTVEGFGGGGAPSDQGFLVRFGGSLAGTNASQLSVTNPSGMTGFVGEIDKGGAVDNQGWQVTSTGNSAPAVNAGADYTIPYRTPFRLSGSGSDPDGDALTFLWEQNDPGGASGTGLTDTNKTNGPLFRQFGTALDGSVYDPTVYNSPGENHPTSSRTRVLPDMAQILANNTNADTGACAGSGAVRRDCLSEWLPTPVYAGPMNFRLTARDNNPGGGGVGSDDMVVTLAPGTGPFRVTQPNTAVTWVSGTSETITWDVAGTALAPVATSDVEILLSTNGGASFSQVLVASTPNDGSHTITVPSAETTEARVMVRALGNIFFDVSNQDFSIVETADMEVVSKADSQDPAYAGENLTYTIRVRNNGPAPGDNAQVVDALPSQVDFVSSSIPCTEAPAGTLTCGLGTMAAGAETTFTITVSIPPDAVHDNGGPFTMTNTATASSDRDDPVPGNDAKSEQTEVRARADMELVSKADAPDPAWAGEEVTYTIRARNNGPSTATNARVVDVLPAGASSVSSSIPCAESPAGTLTCGLGHLDPGDERTFTVTVFLARDLVYNHGSPITITNTATARSDVDDVVAGNDAKAEDTLVRARADLEILSFEAVDPPAELTIGEARSVTLRKVIANRGTAAPMDVRVARGAGASPNATVSPAFTSHVEVALGYEEERTVDEVFDVACTAPGPATFMFANEIDPDRPDDVEIDDSDNHAMTSLTVECIMPVAINIKPGSSKNPVNLKSNGVIPVAVLTTLAGEYGLPLDFDATEIDALTARFGPEGLVVSGGGAHEVHDRGHVEDAIERSDEMTRDGDLDMVLHFRTQESGLGPLETEACVRGIFGPGYVFHGCDTMTIVS